ncbi:ABC transporter substrate-binding protein [Arthrobacter sp. 2MCAF15]|uniref:ABC transporter substrate-binding protein n=1 Tax=Arthrobacter sp. 2MCAF15 TaxID=3232984 RepID=UPI003F90D953
MKRRNFLATAAAATILIAATGCGGPSSAAGTAKTSLSLATYQTPNSYVPGEMPNYGPADQYFQAVYDSLLNINEKGEPVPNLASEWSYDSSQKVLSLTLREGIKFTDGAVLDANAVKANLEKAKTGKGEAGSALKSVSAVDVKDATHVTLSLAEPDPSLLGSLSRASGYMASPQALGKSDLKTNPVGSGPYKLDQSKSTAGDSYVFTRNPDYWNKAAYPYDELKIRLLENATAALNGMRTGQLQGALASSNDFVKGAKDAGMNVTTYTNGALTGIYLWDREGKLAPALADVRVRQAINYAIDRDSLIKTLGDNRGKKTVQIFAPATAAYDASLENAYPYDVEKAKKLMAEAGYSSGFALKLPDFSPVFPAAQAAMTESMAAIGITITYEPITADQVVGSIFAAKWPMNFFTVTSSGAWNASQQTLLPDALFNPFKVSDPKVVELLNKAEKSDDAGRDAALRELNKHVVDQAWFAPWYFEEGAYVTTKDVAVTPQANVSVPALYNFKPAK